MANSSMLQHTNTSPLTHFLLKRNVGEHNVRICQLARINDHGRGSARGLSLQMIRQNTVIAPSFKIRAQHACGDHSSSDNDGMEKFSFLDVKLEIDRNDLHFLGENDLSRGSIIRQNLESLDDLCTRAEVDLAYGKKVPGVTGCVILPLMEDIYNTLFTMAKDKAKVWIHSHRPGQPGGEGPTTLGEILIHLTYPLKENAKCVKEFLASFKSKFKDDKTGPQDYFHELFSIVTTFNKNLASVYQEVEDYTSDGYFKLEGEKFIFDRNKSKLLEQNMSEALKNRLPNKTRAIVGIAGQLGYSILEYIVILQMLKKLK